MNRIKKVAVITRTKNRTILLWRAFHSVLKQSFKDFIWIIVNDGGEKEGVDRIATEARNNGIDVRVLHHEHSKGMEVASNAGIRSCESEYIIIHDDDDSWEYDFLEKTVKFLDKRRSRCYIRKHNLMRV